MAERGTYRAIHTVIVDSEDFTSLSSEAQLVWFHLKMRLGPTGIDVIPAVESVLEESTNLSAKAVRDGMGDAIRMGWLRRQGRVLWIPNGLRFEPSLTLSNENHKSSVQKHVAGLPKLKIVNDFAEYYELEKPFPDQWDTPSHAGGIPDHGRRKTETETETTTALSAGADVSSRFEEVWKLHGRGAKKKAQAAYRKAVPKLTTHENLLEHLKAYVATFRADWHGAHLEKWIRDARWEENLNGHGPGPPGKPMSDEQMGKFRELKGQYQAEGMAAERAAEKAYAEVKA